MGKGNPSLRKRSERQKADKELEYELKSAQKEVDGKTLVGDKVAELSVRGVIKEDEVLHDKDKKKALSEPVTHGIKKKTKKMTSKQKKRQAEAIEKAAKFEEVKEKKVADSVAQLHKIRQRKKPWEQMDEDTKPGNKFAALTD